MLLRPRGDEEAAAGPAVVSAMEVLLSEPTGEGCLVSSEADNEPGAGQITAVMICLWPLERSVGLLLWLWLLLLPAAAAAAKMSLAKWFACWQVVALERDQLWGSWSASWGHLLLAADCCWLLAAGCVAIRLGLIRKDLGILGAIIWSVEMRGSL